MKPRGLTAEDLWLGACTAAILLAAGALYAVNALKFHYHGTAYLHPLGIGALCPLIELIVFAACARGLAPKTAFAVRDLSSCILLWGAMLALTTAVQYTPFPTIDDKLLAWDEALHFFVLDFMGWTSRHPHAQTALRWIYGTLGFEFPVVALLAALSEDRRRMRVYLYAFAYTTLLGELFYYFFPSSGPASIILSPLFAPEQRLTGWKFREVHSFHPVDTIAGGMIAFPSFHAIWAILMTYAAASTPRFFWVFALLNALILASTLLLGWHFLVDILAAAALSGLCLWAGEATHRRLSTS